MSIILNSLRSSKRIWTISLGVMCICFSLISCGGSDDDDNTESNSSSGAETTTSNTTFEPANAVGVWDFSVFVTEIQEESCDIEYPDSQNFNLKFKAQEACIANREGVDPNPIVLDDGFSSQVIEEVIDCGGGIEAALIRTVSCTQINNNTGLGSLLYEVQCPNAGCKVQYLGDCAKNSDNPDIISCLESSSSASTPPVTPPTATTTPTSGSSNNTPSTYSGPACSSKPDSAWCRRCSTGKACGNSCIARDRQCYTPPGCACNR